MTTRSWTGIPGADWYASTNWSPNNVPQTGDTVLISAGTVDISLADIGTNGTLDNLTIDIGSSSALSPATLAADGESFGAGITIAFDLAFAALALTGTTEFAGTIEASLNGGIFTITDQDSDDAGAGDLTNTGTMSATNGAALAIATSGAFINDGSVIASGATATIGGTVDGFGWLDVGNGGTLVLLPNAVVSAEQTINFTSASGTIDIETTTADAIAATITGFALGDVIDLTAIIATSYSFDPSNGVLELFNGTTTPVATLEIGGDFSGNANAFHLTSDGAGGTLITAQATWTWLGGTGDFYSGTWSVNVPIGSATAPQPGDIVQILSVGTVSNTVSITASDVSKHGVLDNLFVGIGSTKSGKPATLTADGATFSSRTLLDVYQTVNGLAAFAALSFSGPTTLAGEIFAAGSLILSDGSSVATGAGNFTIASTGELLVFGDSVAPSIAGVLTNDGIMIADGGTLTLTGNVQGSGTSLLAFNGTVDIASGTTIGSGQSFVFYDNTNLLKIDGTSTSHVTATIADFTSGDRIDLTGIKADSIDYDVTTGLASLFETGTIAPVATLQFPLGETNPDLSVTTDGGSGTLVQTTRAAGDGADVALHANIARSEFKVDGTGIKIGILSDSFNLKGLQQTDINNGDLPAGVTVVEEGTSGNDEGRAMAELVHRIAPGAQIFFYTGVVSETDFANGITTLADLGCTVIVDDLTYLDEPYYQDAGPVTAAVESVVQSGVSYFTSAGNNGSQFYEQTFTPITAALPGGGAATLNDFGGGNPLQSLTLPLNATFEVGMQWSQPFTYNSNAGSNDTLGFLLYDSNGNLVASATSDAIGNDPVQFLDYTNTTGSTAFRLAVELINGPAPTQFKYIEFSDGAATAFIDQSNAYTGSGTVIGHEAAVGANVVGAAPYYQTPAFGAPTPLLESFSSIGPGETLFDAAGNPVTPTSTNEPTFVSADGVGTDVFNPFFGTSAAAPDAAAVAALMLQANSKLDPADVTNLLKDSAIVMGTPSPNSSSGAGLIQADRAVQFAVTGTITYETDGNTTLWGTHLDDVFAAGDNVETFMLAGGTDSVLVPSAAAMNGDTVEQFGVGDDITLLDVSATDAQLIGDILNVTNAGSTVVAMFTVPGIASGMTFRVVQDGANSVITQAACFLRGTRIATPAGTMPIEALASGDLVLTLSGDPRPVRWIGHRLVDLQHHPMPETVRPIRILRNAVAPDMPCRDLLVSPDHAVLIDERLIPARFLVNGATVRYDDGADSAQYFHIELATHDVLLAEGLPAESYLDTGNRRWFDNGAEAAPRPAAVSREVDGCLPLTVDATSVEPIWQRLTQRVRELGIATSNRAVTDDPALYLMVGQHHIRPISTTGGRYVFALPYGATHAQLVSRTATPSAARPWCHDKRSLGVMVRRIAMRSGGDVHHVPIDHPMLDEGWWPVEHDGQALFRWTGGDAALPLQPAVDILELDVAATLAYPVC